MRLEVAEPVKCGPEMFEQAKKFAAIVIQEFDDMPEGTFPPETDRKLTILNQSIYQILTALRAEGLSFTIEDSIDAFTDVIEEAVSKVSGD